MINKYQKVVRSTAAFLEMTENDIMRLGKNNVPHSTVITRQLPKHITPPRLTRNSSSHVCHVPKNQNQHNPELSYKTKPVNFVDFDVTKLLLPAEKVAY